MIYLDSSALVKLAVAEPETAALASYLAEHGDQAFVSSSLHRAEVLRAIWRAEPGNPAFGLAGSAKRPARMRAFAGSITRTAKS